MSKTLKVGVTAYTPTGGSDETYVGVPSNEQGESYANSDETTASLRERLNLRARIGSISGSGVVTKEKRTARLTVPVADAVTGEIRYAAVRIEFTADPRDFGDLIGEMRMKAAELATGAQFDDFHDFGTEV